MNAKVSFRVAKRPRWDGSRIRFEIEVEGAPISCGMSAPALWEISGCNYIRPDDLLRHFAAHRDRIEAIAAGIFAVRPNSITGMLHIWADDLDTSPVFPEAALQSIAAQH